MSGFYSRMYNAEPFLGLPTECPESKTIYGMPDLCAETITSN